jgi:hypothetical protein
MSVLRFVGTNQEFGEWLKLMLTHVYNSGKGSKLESVNLLLRAN